VLSAGTSGAPVTSPGDTVLVEFAMQRCQHCQAMQPVVARLTQQGVNVQVVDAEQRADLRARFKVTGVPTFVAVSGGQEIGRIEGVASFEKLADLAQGSTVKAATSGRALPSSELPPDQSARAATVRIKVEDPTGYGFGTGTIIDTHDGEALVVTCGHLFRESKGQGKITAACFARASPPPVEGQRVAYNLERDVALISLKTGGAVRPAMVAPPGYTVRPGDRVFTLGSAQAARPKLRPSQ